VAKELSAAQESAEERWRVFSAGGKFDKA